MTPVTLFAYGTLRHPAVITYVLGREPEREEVEVEGFVRYRIRNADYPGILPQRGSRIDGTLFRDITPEEWERLDEYESDLYLRQTVTVLHPEGGTSIAFAYVLPPEHESICTEEPWDLNHYHPRHLPE
jgi:gamma-glutamylcyclotransferase (GGCT)/AIG2-like uncharacterized protein YtfP